MLRLFADECVDARISDGLRRRGEDVVTAGEEGLLGASDDTQLARATSLGRVLLTADQDFLLLAHRRIIEGASFPGVLFLLPEASVGEAVRAICVASAVLDPDDMANRIEWLP